MTITITPLVIDLNEILRGLFQLSFFAGSLIVIGRIMYGAWFWQFNKSQQPLLNHGQPYGSQQCEACPFNRVGKVSPENGANSEKPDATGNTDGNCR